LYINFGQVEVTGATSHEELSDHDKNSDNDKSVIMISLEEKLLECERTIHLLTQELHKQKEKSIQDQTMFIKTLSDLQTFNSGKQHYLEATITGLQKELQTEKLRTSKQTQSIRNLTIANNFSTNRADSLQVNHYSLTPPLCNIFCCVAIILMHLYISANYWMLKLN